MISNNVRVVDREHPWITAEEDDVVSALREQYPATQTEWYSVPHSRVGSDSDADSSDDDDSSDC
jgi:hypothetical protein